MDLPKGANAPLGAAELRIVLTWPHQAGEVDVSAYLLGAEGRVRGDADMVFFNQSATPDGAVRLADATFTVALDRMPAATERIVFCLTAASGTLAAFDGAAIAVGGDLRFQPQLAGASEAAMIFGEVYRRGPQWKFRAVGQGFNGGLAPLARSFGIKVADEPPPPPPTPPALTAVSLEKKVAAKAPQLVNLAKTAAVSLEKNRLGQVRAQVVLVLDATGSMTRRYDRGTVQAVVDRILPLAVHFDDDGALDVWAYAQEPGRLSPITLDNVRDYVRQEGGGWRRWPLGARFNDEPAVIRPLVETYRRGSLPTYIVFISDGGVSANREIERLLRDAAAWPIFWQFVGIGGSSYGVFEKLDTMAGRRVDNCNFFALDDLSDVSDGELYDWLLGEFPSWLGEARRAGVLR